MADLLEFTWEVAASGYEWLEASPVAELGRTVPKKIGQAKNSYLVAREPQRRSGSAAEPRLYQPLVDYKNLFQVFALTPPEREAILLFANKYGTLGGRNQAIIGIVASLQQGDSISVSNTVIEPDHRCSCKDEISHHKRYVPVDSFDVWASQIKDMRLAFKVWELLNTRDKVGLKKLFDWRNGMLYVCDPENGFPTHSHSYVTFFNLTSTTGNLPIDKDDVIRTAELFLCDFINENIDGLVLPKLVPQSDAKAATLRIVPKGLIGAMWLQFAQAVDRKRSYKQCLACGKWFDISNRFGARADKKTCDATCRMRLSRKLASEGTVANTTTAELPQDR